MTRQEQCWLVRPLASCWTSSSEPLLGCMTAILLVYYTDYFYACTTLHVQLWHNADSCLGVYGAAADKLLKSESMWVELSMIHHWNSLFKYIFVIVDDLSDRKVRIGKQHKVEQANKTRRIHIRPKVQGMLRNNI